MGWMLLFPHHCICNSIILSNFAAVVNRYFAQCATMCFGKINNSCQIPRSGGIAAGLLVYIGIP